MRFSRTLISTVATTLLAGTTFAPAFAQSDSAALWYDAGKVVPVDATREPVYGPAVSDFSLIVWLDPECPYCKELGKTPETVVDASGGKVNLAVRMMPLAFHGRPAFIAAATALCVGQQGPAAGYFRFVDRYLELTRTNGAGLPEGPDSSVEALAREAGITDAASLDRCVHAPETVQLMGSEFDAAREAGVTGTPTIVVRDNRNGMVAMAVGAIGGDELMRVIRVLNAKPAK